MCEETRRREVAGGDEAAGGWGSLEETRRREVAVTRYGVSVVGPFQALGDVPRSFLTPLPSMPHVHVL